MNGEPKASIDSYYSIIIEYRWDLSEYYACTWFMAEIAPELNDDDVVIFLRDEPNPQYVFTRLLRDVLRIASITGFGFMVEFGEDFLGYCDVGTLSTSDRRQDRSFEYIQYVNMKRIELQNI